MNIRKLLGFGRMTNGEYRANIEGMNIFFGAVLGIVLGGTDAIPAFDFAFLLLTAAATVISILYISSSENRYTYIALTAFIIAFLPRIIESIIAPARAPDHLQPTLAVWALMVTIVELLPRERPDAAQPPAP
jgi:hypothetical protein